MNILEYNSFCLVGIKGVAMTALAQCLVDAGKKVVGSDVAEEFVTQKILNKLPIVIEEGFNGSLPVDVECVIYTAAHQAQNNPQVQEAVQRKIPVISHAEALASLFNQKQGIAVCGVGGKSTTSAMIAWILSKSAQASQAPSQSFAVGVGNIPGLEKTGCWNPDSASKYFVSEADEYVTDPSAPSRGEAITPRFSFLKPFAIVCTNLQYDHPDVYKDFAQTQAVYQSFFEQTWPSGSIIFNADDQPLTNLVLKAVEERSQKGVSTSSLSFGKPEQASLRLTQFVAQPGQTLSTIDDHHQTYQLTLQIPGEFNVLNAAAAMLVCNMIGIPYKESIKFLAEFRSTMRRSEFVGQKHGVKYYDDYAHHPDEIRQVIHAFKEWYPEQKLVVAFQSHTYSRTKALFKEFVNSFAEADEVVMIDIFPSAREQKDETVSSDLLCDAIRHQFPQLKARNLKTITALAEYFQTQLHSGEVVLTLGAGDIYKVHELLV